MTDMTVTAAAPARVTPTVSMPVRVSWGDWVEQALAHETPFIESVAEAGLGLALKAIPFGGIVSMFVGPTVIKQLVDLAMTALEGVVAGQGTTVPDGNAVFASVANMLNANYPQLAAFLGTEVEPMIEAAIAKILPGFVAPKS